LPSTEHPRVKGPRTENPWKRQAGRSDVQHRIRPQKSPIRCRAFGQRTGASPSCREYLTTPAFESYPFGSPPEADAAAFCRAHSGAFHPAMDHDNPGAHFMSRNFRTNCGRFEIPDSPGLLVTLVVQNKRLAPGETMSQLGGQRTIPKPALDVRSRRKAVLPRRRDRGSDWRERSARDRRSLRFYWRAR
jgi:hypothetical protein